MRIDVEKLMFIGLSTQRAAFFKEAQQLGLIEFIDRTPKKGHALMPENEAQYVMAMKVLRTVPSAEQMEPEEDAPQADELVKTICQLHHTLEGQREELRLLRIESARVAPFGDFSLDDIHAIEREGQCVIQFFAAKQHAVDSLAQEEGLIQVGTWHGLSYFLSIQKEKKSYPYCVEMQIPEPLGVLQKKAAKLAKAIERNEQSLKGYAKYARFLQHAYVALMNQHHYRVAYGKVELPMDEKLFVAEGWAPVDKHAALQKLSDEAHVQMDKIALEDNETPPTYLENEGASKIGEDLIRIYDTPSHTDNDPSLWVFWFFALFFAMIVGDGGYGLVYLAIALFLWYRYPNVQGIKRRVLKLMMILGTACVAWGFLSGTFFGVPLHYHHPLRKGVVLDVLAEKNIEYHMHMHDQVYQDLVAKYPAAKEATSGKELFDATMGGNLQSEVLNQFVDNSLVELVLLIAVVHISLSLCRYALRNWPAIGWVLFLIGAYLYVPTYLGSISMAQSLLGISTESAARAGMQLMIGGIIIAVGLSLIQNRLLGLLEITNVLGVSADVLSYLRLYALGLSGAIVGATVNDLAAGLPAVLSILLLIAGHLLNLVLATMGGVIHGLRLNFLEWYRYSFQGGGKPFTPLKIQKID